MNSRSESVHRGRLPQEMGLGLVSRIESGSPKKRASAEHQVDPKRLIILYKDVLLVSSLVKELGFRGARLRVCKPKTPKAASSA